MIKNYGSAIEHQYNNEIPWRDYGDALGYYLEAQKDSKGKVIWHKIVAIKTEDCLKSDKCSDKVDSSNDKRLQMTNLLKETISAIEYSGHEINDVVFIGSNDKSY